MKEIVQDGAPVLREIAKSVPEELFGSAELLQIVADMTEALDKEPEGVALAAPQIAVPYRLFIVREDRTNPPENSLGNETPKLDLGVSFPSTKPEVEVYINPEIIKTSRRRALGEEGCLSTRGIYGVVNHHERVTVSARRIDGTHFTRGGGGLMAQIFEHEIDHLNGILFIDRAERFIDISHVAE